MTKGELTNTTGTGTGTVVLPYTQEQFKDFIEGLLGKPQTITRVVPGPFEIDREAIANLHHLLSQRISSQNNGVLVQFSILVTYDDGSSVVLNSVDSFLTYNEVKPLVSIFALATWTFVIQFANKSAPEKQVIEVAFGSPAPVRMRRGEYIVSEDFTGYGQSMSLKISHTDRTWGADIDALISSHLQNYTKYPKGFVALLNKNPQKIGFSVFGIGTALSIAGVFEAITRIDTEFQRSIKTLQDSGFEVVSTSKFVATSLANSTWTKVGIYGFIFVVAAIVLAALLGVAANSYCERRGHSFLLLTAKTIEVKNEYQKRRQNNWLRLGAAALGSVGLGVIGNYVFLWLTKPPVG